MKILELQLRAFGPFTEKVLDFSQSEANFHILHGPNEVGKSSALRALTALFYGIPVRTTDDFRHDKKNLQLAARLLHSDGTKLEFVRLKKRKEALVDFDDQPVSDQALIAMLGGVDEKLFTTLFGLSHEELVRGGNDILQGQGAIGESLFAAGIGNSPLRQILQRLDDEAGEWFLPRGRQRKINVAIQAYNEAKKESARQSLSSQNWEEHNSALTSAQKEKEQISKQLQLLRQEHNRLDRYSRVLPLLAERKTLVSQLEELGDIPPLPLNFAQQLKETSHDLNYAQRLEVQASADLKQIERRLFDLNVPKNLLQHGESIDQLYETWIHHRERLAERSSLEGKQTQLEADIQRVLQHIRPGLTLEAAEAYRLTADQRIRIQELGNRHHVLTTQLHHSQQAFQSIQANQDSIQVQLSQLSAIQDISELNRAIRRAEKLGSPEGDLHHLQTRLQADEHQLDIALQQLPLWEGTVAQLEALPIPPAETLERFEIEWNEVLQELKTLQTQLQTLHKKRTALDRKIQALNRGGEVPSEDDLQRARDHRDKGWQLVRDWWLEGIQDAEQVREFDAELPLSDAYEHSVLHVDRISDRLRFEADRVATQESLLSEQAALEEEWEHCQAELQNCEKRNQALQESWKSIWNFLDIQAFSPREMRAWVQRQHALLQQWSNLRELRSQVQVLQHRIDEHRSELIQCLQNIRTTPLPTSTLLEELLEQSHAIKRHSESTAQQQAQLNAQRTQLEQQLSQAQKNTEHAEAQLQEWSSNWHTMMTSIGLSQSTTPAEANAVISALDELFQKLHTQHETQRSLAEINRDASEFDAAVQHWVKAVATDLLELPSEQAIQELKGRLTQAREDRITHQDLEHQHQEKEKQLREAQLTIEETHRVLDSLCRTAKCKQHEELEAVELRFSQAQALKEQCHRLDLQLLDYGGGLTVEELTQAVAALDPDELQARLPELTNRIEQYDQRRSELDEQIGRESQILKQMDGSSNAAEIAENMQNHTAQIREGVNRYIQLRLAAIVLRKEMERYRQENQDPVLRRASELFSQLTLHSFAALRTEYEDNEDPVLLGIRPSGEEVEVNGMSEGTRDQLYLSLRLSSLERYLSNHEPMPFIVDDILVNFDDHRSKALLKILADLSLRTQILLFTHHSHLVQIAHELLTEKQLQVHDLDS